MLLELVATSGRDEATRVDKVEALASSVGSELRVRGSHHLHDLIRHSDARATRSQEHYKQSGTQRRRRLRRRRRAREGGDDGTDALIGIGDASGLHCRNETRCDHCTSA